MSAPILDTHLHDELKGALERGLATGALKTPDQIERELALFRERFEPDVLGKLDGEALLQLMHGRQNVESKCLAYWLEFKDDEKFAGKGFGRIGGGSSFMYGIFQRQRDGVWMGGGPTHPKVLSPEEARAKARQQRDELLAGNAVLAAFDSDDTADEAYSRLQKAMDDAAPELSRIGWAHKYWFLLHSDRLDDYHSPRYQRFHLFKLLQMPPDQAGVRDGGSPRFLCAGRFIAAAKELDVPVTTLDTVLNQRDGGFHRYWRVGTTAGDKGESQWLAMRDGKCVSIGWKEEVSNLSSIIGQKNAHEQIRQLLIPFYKGEPSLAARKAGEIVNFSQEMVENDLVLACEGQTVLGVGRVRGPYEYDSGQHFPHKRLVDWLLLERWSMPQEEGLRTSVAELGRSAENLLELERRLYASRIRGDVIAPSPAGILPLPELDATAKRVENILRRKGQVILYGPPGTGKTFHARRVARELASRSAFGKTFVDLTETEKATVDGDAGLVRLCTFHPGYGYEDFVEGLRPRTTVAQQMVFEPQDGVFKRLCDDASKQDRRHFFLVVDEINRGDVPRIFGELITVIEQDKRGVRVILPITGKSFSVPPNVFLIGTMNTADRSISLLDAALRRRFGFIELMPDSSQLDGRKAGALPLGPWLDALNERLRKYLKRDARNLQIGHAYLLPRQPITSVADFGRVLRDDIIPLLEEYCYDDFQTLRDILDSKLVDIDAARINDELFAPNREEELIQAIWFEQLGPLALDESLTDGLVSGSESAGDDHEGEDGPEPSS